MATLTAALLVGAFMLVNVPLVGAWLYETRFDLSAARLPAAAQVTASDRLLVFAPHPDDEVLCCGGFIQEALAAGALVRVVYVTAGDAFELAAVVAERELGRRGSAMVQLGRLRFGEAQAAMGVLGLAPGDLTLLGFPDRGLRELVIGPADRVYTSPYTLRSSVPYEQARSPGLAYTGAELRAEVAAVIEEFAPTLVLAPTLRDRHPDHRAVGAVVAEALAATGHLDSGRWYIVHGDPEWPLPKGVHLRQPLFPPLRARELPWERVDLEPEWEVTKLQAIYEYRSQVAMMKRYLQSFAKRNELLSRAPE